MALTQVKTLGIADDAVTLAKQAAGTDGQIITYDASGNPTAVGPGTDGQVLTSTGSGSPPAFEDAATSVGGATGVDFNDNVKIRLGTGNDWEMYHTGSINKFESESHRLIISGAAAENVDIMKTQSEYMAKFIPDGAVELYHNNVKKIETTSSGVTLSSAGANTILIGSTDANGATLALDGDSNGDGSGADYCYIQHGTDGDLTIHCDNPSNDADFELYVKDGSEKAIFAKADGAVELYHNHSLKFETSATGINVNGKPTYSCRAWAKVDGDAGTLAFHGEEGFSSITDSGTGDYRLQLDDDFGDTNGSVVTSDRVASTSAQQWYLIYAHFQESDKIDIIGQHNWTSLSPKICDDFYER